MAKNFDIITEEGKSISSKDYWGFTLEVVPDPQEIHLIACHVIGELNVIICIFKGEDRFTKAWNGLSSLYEAIGKSDSVWRVKDHISDLLRS